MTNQAGAEQQAFVLGSDAPTHPQHDAFGYAPLAKRIAAAICTTQSPTDGYVAREHNPNV